MPFLPRDHPRHGEEGDEQPGADDAGRDARPRRPIPPVDTPPAQLVGYAEHDDDIEHAAHHPVARFDQFATASLNFVTCRQGRSPAASGPSRGAAGG